MAARRLRKAAKSACLGRGQNSFRAEGRPAATYRAEITEIGVTLAITGTPLSAEASRRTT
jgi:hypothetical protein